MFSFFQKKHFLVDYLEGFVDIHNHILPGIDDGAKTTDDSLALIKGFGEFGITDFVCTPHIMHNYYENTLETIKDSFITLKKEMAEKGITDVSIDFAAEHMIDDNFEEILKKKQVLPLRNYHLLIEMSFLQAPINFHRAVKKITSAGYYPILAHPERYAFLYGNFQKYEAFKRESIFFQVNLLSLAGYYGGNVKNMAIKLLDKGMIDFLGSDVHHKDQLKFLKDSTISHRILKKIQPVIANTIDNFF
ncbi:tyrosine-protein phosphatase [Allomuricauda sp. SCSIO 65647]|uniref:tyrosine-protein phosphatase n=1 Tax=Allomuricauda sp. SCSIO 65647 TaxID=2908843 RepID=UPI001F324275|nr:CpsB/CapC family capsule biosynthesis tyrosine phosphatase [Muricauda sp. SCSIO 65647]UJH67037.1 histidinol phosphatase [Muricauda sp. SCSIO 65647]